MNNTYNVDMSAKNIMKFGNVAEETKTLEEKVNDFKEKLISK